MKVIIAGTRDFNDYPALAASISSSCWEIDEVVSGGASGADALGEHYAKCHSIPIKLFKADWNTFGKAAGPIRNREMANYADALFAVWDGKSRGTKNMIEEARKRGLRTYVMHYNTKELLDE